MPANNILYIVIQGSRPQIDFDGDRKRQRICKEEHRKDEAGTTLPRLRRFIHLLQLAKNLLFSPHEVFIAQAQRQERQIERIPFLCAKILKQFLVSAADYRNERLLLVKNPFFNVGQIYMLRAQAVRVVFF